MARRVQRGAVVRRRRRDSARRSPRPTAGRGRPGPLPDADLHLGQALADVATIGILHERAIRHGEVVTEQLQATLNSGVAMEHANGVLAQQGTLTMETAFDRMRRYSQGHDLLLGEVAASSPNAASPARSSPSR